MRKMFGKTLLTSLLTLSGVGGVANAQNTTPPAKPDLEPKAIELL